MAKSNQRGQMTTIPPNIFPIISLVTGIFGWLLALFIMLISFSSLATYFHFGRTAGLFVILLPGFSWLTSLITGVIGIRQIKKRGSQKGTGLAKSGIITSGIGCALFYGFLLVIAYGFYVLISKGYIGFILHSGNVML